MEKYFEPIIKVLQNGIGKKMIKDVNFDILTAFIFFPVMTLSNSRICKNFDINEDNIETAFSLAWDAIKF